MISSRLLLCGVGLALLSASPVSATTTVASGDYTAGVYTSEGGTFSLDPGRYQITLSFSQPVGDFDGLVEKIFGYDDFCDLGAGQFPCGGDDVPIDLTFEMVTPELYRLMLTVNGSNTLNPAGDFVVREDTYESCCGFGFGFSSDAAGHFTLSYASVPEPATWMMMLLGFGGIGFAARRRASRLNALATS